MSFHHDLLLQARSLATNEPKRPKQASLRRAVSSAYYAVFHLLVDESTRLLVSGKGRAPLRGALSRSYSHGAMRDVARSFMGGAPVEPYRDVLTGRTIPVDLRNVAEAFVLLQQARHDADYDNTKRWSRLQALEQISLAEQAFKDWAKIRSRPEAEAFLVALLAQKQSRS